MTSCLPGAQTDQEAKRLSNLGLAQYESHHYLQAEATFRSALGIDNSLFVPNLFLGLDLLQLKRPREAVGYLMTAKTQNPQDPEAALALGRAYHMLFDPARSRDWYQRATELAPRKGEAWYGLGLAYFGLAESVSAKLISAFPNSPYVAELTAEAQAPRSVDVPASCVATPSPGRQADDAAGLYGAVRAYQRFGIAALTCARQVEPDSPRIHALLGDAYQHQNMFREAEDEYARMLALDPNNLAGLAGLASAYFADGQLPTAEATAQKALTREPGDGEINLLMGEILVAEHKNKEAETCLQRSLHVRPDLLPRVHALLGNVFAKTGRPKEAITELTQGLASDEDGSVYYQLARLYQNCGNEKAAAAAFEKSQQIRAKRNAVSQERLAPAQ